jgi:hypothetical protein
MSRFGFVVIVTLAVLIGVGELPALAKGARRATPHRHHAQRAHKPTHKVHPKNPTRRPKHTPKQPVKARPKPKPGTHVKTPPKRTVTPKSPGTPKTPGNPKRPKTPPVVGTPKLPAQQREVRRFVNYNDRTREFSFDHRWWYNFVVYPTTVSRTEAFTANYNTLVPPPNITVKPPLIKPNEGLPISPAGSSLVVMLDRLDVEHRWLPGQQVAWRSGEVVDDSARGPASNAGGFVAAVCAQLKVPMPSPTGDNLLSASQHDWLLSDGLKRGWVEVGALEAQLLANQGWVVVAAWKDAALTGDRSVGGQTAIVRPNRRRAADIAPNGPRVIEAGIHNQSDISLKDGFPAKAWATKQVVYLAHRPG